MGIFKVEYFVEFVGMTDPSSKRKVTWKWMIAEDSSGSTGIEPQELTLTWSIYSGKRRFEVNGYEELFTIDKSGIIDERLQMQNGTELRVVATKTAPENSASFFRLYELLIDGRSFFTFPESAHARGRDLTYIPSGYGGKTTSILQILYPNQVFDGSDSANDTLQQTSDLRRNEASPNAEAPSRPLQTLPMQTTAAPEVDLLDFSEPVTAPAQVTPAPFPVAASPPTEGFQMTPPELPPPPPPTMADPIGMMVTAPEDEPDLFSGSVSVLGDPDSPKKEQNPFATTYNPFATTNNPFASTQTVQRPDLSKNNDSIDLFGTPTQAVSPNDSSNDKILVEQSAVPTAAPAKMLFDPFA